MSSQSPNSSSAYDADPYLDFRGYVFLFVKLLRGTFEAELEGLDSSREEGLESKRDGGLESKRDEDLESSRDDGLESRRVGGRLPTNIKSQFAMVVKRLNQIKKKTRMLSLSRKSFSLNMSIRRTPSLLPGSDK